VRDRASPLSDLIAAYVHAFLILTSLTATCNRLHSIDERLRRSLRMTYNRARRTEFSIRHEFLAQMLGVHRPTVSTAAGMLQEAGLISYRYGKLSILNPQGLADGALSATTSWRRSLNESSTNPGAQSSGSPASGLKDVRNRLDKAGFSFLLTDVELALTLARIAQDADTDSEKRARNRNNARRAYDTITSLMSRVTLTGEEEQELTGKLSQLKSELHVLGEGFSIRNHR
jgi:hypothetical protein